MRALVILCFSVMLAISGYVFVADYHEPSRLEQKVADLQSERAREAAAGRTAQVERLNAEISEARSDRKSANLHIAAMALLATGSILAIYGIIRAG